MKSKNFLCLAGTFFIILVCLASGGDVVQSASNRADLRGSGNIVSQGIDQNAQSIGGGNIWQDADNVANVGGQGSQVSQGITQNAQSGPVKLIIPTGVTPPLASSLQMRAMYQGVWTLGPIPVCYGNSLDTAIKNDQDQYLRVYEIYPDGQMQVTDLGYHRAGELVHATFVGDVPGEHMFRTGGSVSGWSNDIIKVQVVPCGYGGMPTAGGNIWQGASNTANVGGSGNWVDQDINQNAWNRGGGDVWQDADNVANVRGWNNQVDQDINQNAWNRGGGDVWQDADNVANVRGWNNQVDQDINQNAWNRGGGDVWQDADNWADVNGWNNRVNQSINQNAIGGGITQTAGNRANVRGTNNDVIQSINQNAASGGVTQSGGNYVSVSGSGNDVSVREDQSATGNAVAESGGVSINSQSSPW